MEDKKFLNDRIVVTTGDITKKEVEEVPTR
jgi:hypothetical protein